MDSNSLLDSLKAHAHVTSERALALNVLKCDPMTLRDMRQRGLSDERALFVADALGLNPFEVLAAVHAERAKNPAVKKTWEKLAHSLRTAATGAVAAVFLILGAGTPTDARADGCTSFDITRYTLSALRRWWLVLVALFALSAPAQATDAWSPSDKALEAVYLGLLGTEWSQTRDLARQPERYHETCECVWLGEHPSVGEVNSWFFLMGLAHVGVTDFLPARFRPWFQYATILVVANNVQHNRMIGLRLDF